MTKIRRIIAAFLVAWGMISDYTLPRSIISHFRMQIPTKLVLFCFPLTGVAAGVIASIPALFVSLLFNRLAGALVFTFCGALLLFFRDSGRGLALLASYINARMTGVPPAIAFQRCDSSLANVLRNPVVMLFTGIGIMLILGMLFALFYRGAALWLAAVCGADAMVQARLCLESDRNSKLPFIQGGAKGHNALAVSSVILAVLLLLIFRKIAALGVFVVLWVWFWRELPGAEEFRDGLSPDWITLSGFWAALITLLCGMGLL